MKSSTLFAFQKASLKKDRKKQGKSRTAPKSSDSTNYPSRLACAIKSTHATESTSYMQKRKKKKKKKKKEIRKQKRKTARSYMKSQRKQKRKRKKKCTLVHAMSKKERKSARSYARKSRDILALVRRLAGVRKGKRAFACVRPALLRKERETKR